MSSVGPTCRLLYEHHKSTCRLHKVFDRAGWEKLIIASQHINFQPLRQFVNSIVGKIVIFTLAETGGAYLGSVAGKRAVGKVTLAAGELLFPIVVSLMATCTVYQVATKISRKTHHLFLGLTSIYSAYLLNQSFIRLAEVGASTGFQFGQHVGSNAGAVLGGGAALYLAGSPIQFWDKQDPWSCYLVCMARYLAVQIACDLFFGTQSIPMLAIVMSIVTFPIRTIAPTLAYNSNAIIPAINCLKEEGVPKKPLTTLVIQLITNKINGKNTQYRPRLDEKIHSVLEPVFWHMKVSSPNNKLPGGLRRLYKMLLSPLNTIFSMVDKVKGSVEQKKDAFVDKAVRQFVVGTLRSVHEYINLLKNSQITVAAQTNFKAAYGDPSKQQEAHKVLVAALDEMVKNVPGFTQKIFNSFANMADNNIHTMVTTIVDKIQELEVQVVGVELLKTEQKEYMRDTISIYLKYYLLFAYLNQGNLSAPMTLAEEEAMIIELVNFLVSSYTHQVAPSLATGVSYAIGRGFNCFAKVKKIVLYTLVKQEKTVHYNAQDIKANQIHFKPAPAEKFSENCVVVDLPKDNFVWVKNGKEQAVHQGRKRQRDVQIDEVPTIEKGYFGN